jgi:cephalosporin hydroxylase
VKATDKEENGYLPTYQRIAADLGPSARVCELGVQGGGSLSFWLELLPDCEVTGVDIDPGATWPPGTRKVIADQQDPALPGVLGGLFDLIIDDASHFGEPTRYTFLNLWPLVAPGGYYVVEDWWVGLPEVVTPFRVVNPFFERYSGEGMLETVQSFLRMLSGHKADVDEVTYRFGLAIVHRRKQ